MSPALIVWLSVFVISFIIRVPIALGMIVSSTLYLYIEGIDPGTVIETSAFLPFLTPVILLGGIYAGIFTPSSSYQGFLDISLPFHSI